MFPNPSFFRIHRKPLRELALAMAAFFGLCLPLGAYPLQVLTTNVQPMNGTTGKGNTFPGAVVPFGMVQWSPDTITVSRKAGYLYTDTQIVGFSLNHMSGAGCTFGGDFDFTPILGSVTVSPCAGGGNGKTNFPSTFAHANEIAVPGYYSVIFNNGIRTELTTTTRTGFGRFTYPSGHTATMVINAGSNARGTLNASVQISTSGQEISGWTTGSGFCGSGTPLTLYFDTVFDHAFTAWGVWNGATLTPGGTNATGAHTGVYVSFNLPGGGVVLARTGVSYVSVANARLNLQTESPTSSFTSAGFDAMVNTASNTWNGYLNKIQVSGGTPADTATFYTMMYHALQAPSVVSDVNGQYLGFDGQVHSGLGYTKYEFFSGWDIYRNECQFLAMMDPARCGDMAQSLVQDAQDCGAMPRWSVPSGDTGVMMGDPATPIIAGMYAFGATGFDTAAALAAMVRAAVDPATVAVNGIHERDAERDYLNLGFVPEYKLGGYGPVSMTLEYCSADFALARFAQALGDSTNYVLAMDRAQNWRNLFNTNTGYIQMRRSDGLWSPGFVINNQTYDGYQAYVEGTAAQYVWMVPFNLGSLISLMGGPQAASARLDTFFTQLNAGTASQYAHMGNEPCSQTPWIYNFVGQPWKASSVVRQIMTQLFSANTGGLPGNDDLGQMGSWYVLAALGMHPEFPGDDALVLNGPLFPQAVVHLAGGDVTITAAGAGDNAPYVQSLSVNGQPSNASWIRYADIANGGTLAFVMGTSPNTNWGADPSSIPPSYTDGMTAPLAPSYFWGTGLESGEASLTWTNTVDSGPYPAGGINNVGPITSSPSGPELTIRSENSQSGSKEIMYSGKALGGASDYAYLKAFDLSGQNIVVSPGMRLSYWIFPQSSATSTLVSGSNSAFVALDILFADGTNLRDSGLTDQHGVGIDPLSQGSILALDTWNYVTVELTPLAGKTINRIDLGYNRPGSSGGYRGYVDDIALTIPANPIAAPPIPIGLAASGGYGQVNLSWATAPGAANYTIGRSTVSGAETALATVTTTSYSDTNTVNGVTYYYVVSAANALGQSSNSIEVSAMPVAPPIAAYPQAVLAFNPVGYWRLDETPDNGSGNQGVTCRDYMGGNNGVYSNVLLAQPGYNPVTDPAETATAFGSLQSSNSMAAHIGGNDFSAPSGSNAEFSVAAWVKCAPQTGGGCIVARGYGNGGEQFILDFGAGASHCFRFVVRNAAGSAINAKSTVQPDGNWHLVTGVCDEANGALRLFIDGVERTNAVIAPGTGLQAARAGTAGLGDDQMSIGARTQNSTSVSYNLQTVGTIDDVALFNYALSTNQVAALYAAAPVPVIRLARSSGSLTITYTGTLLTATNVAGPYTPIAGASSPYAVSPAAAQRFYRVSNP